MSENSNNESFSELEILHLAQAHRAEVTARWLKSVFGSLASAFSRRVLEPIRRRQKFNRQYEQLMALDDRLFRDLGISRGDAVYVMRHGRTIDQTPANTNTPPKKAA